jgi:hypothetical protein
MYYNKIEKVKYLLISDNNNEYYCKLIGNGVPGNLWYTFHFGGKKNYCITISTKGNKPEQASLDMIEYNKDCNKNNSLSKSGGTINLLQIALWVVITFFPSIQQIKLLDNSHIDCIQGKKLKKMCLASDYILKYKMTWYERTFKATLPPELYNTYKSSLNILDKPLEDFEFQSHRLYNLQKYKDIYLSSTTPTNFFENLRNYYGTSYCLEVSDWIQKYMILLSVSWFPQEWFIPSNQILKPNGFTMNLIDNIIKGGNYTRKVRHKYYENKVSSLGIYEGAFL